MKYYRYFLLSGIMVTCIHGWLHDFIEMDAGYWIGSISIIFAMLVMTFLMPDEGG